MRVLVVTKSDLRHRLFLKMAEIRLGKHWIGTVVQCRSKRVLRFSDFANPSSLRRMIHGVIRKMSGLVSRFASLRRHDLSPDEYLYRHIELEPLAIEEAPGVLKIDDINSEKTKDHVTKLMPDVVLIFGADILKGFWLSVARLGVLNMHYGILPNYRSGNSTQFACMHERLDLVGATIHYIDAGVDTGPIVARRYIEAPLGYATLNHLISAVYAAGADELLSCAEQTIRTNKVLPATRLEAAYSYYPARLATGSAMQIANWQFGEMKKFWPNFELTIETKVFSRFPQITLQRNKYPNGVYIFLYHGIRDESSNAEWERYYSKVMTPLENFQSHLIWLLNEGFVPVKLSEAFNLLRHGLSDKRYFVVTFDDAYSNLLSVRDILNKAKINPAVFANGSFCSGFPYFRVLASIICARGDAKRLKEILLDVTHDVSWAEEPKKLFNQLKDKYIPDTIEAAVERCYLELYGKINFKCHLGVDDLAALQFGGWEIGNHTWNHQTLSSLNADQVGLAIEKNISFLNENGIKTINWLAYPNGLARHVNFAVKTWLDSHPDMHGIFAGGGINLIPSRTQWLRVPFSGEDREAFVRSLNRSVAVTKKTLGGICH